MGLSDRTRFELSDWVAHAALFDAVKSCRDTIEIMCFRVQQCPCFDKSDRNLPASCLAV